jgi:cytochrome bd ubiquinol oxidase subunit I
VSELPLEIPFIGNRVAVGLMFQLHIVMVAAIMGAAIVAPICEIVGLRRKDPRFERLAHDMAGIIVRFFAFAATWAVVGIVLLVGLYPTLIGTLLSIFFWPAVAISIIWVLMTFGAYFYAYGWERYSNRRVLHNAFGWLFAISAFLFIDLITALSSFQLTPVEPVSLLAAVLNPSWITEVLHRHVGNLSYVGLVMAGIASARMLFERREPDRAYLDWVGHFGLFLGVGVLLLHPSWAGSTRRRCAPVRRRLSSGCTWARTPGCSRCNRCSWPGCSCWATSI